jgi:hypothetical protein
MSNLEKVVGVVTHNHGSEFGEVLTSQHFMAVLDLFQGEKKSALCKKMLTRFVQLPGTTDDTVVIQTMFDLTRTLHDSIDSLSFDDERRQVDTLMCKFIKKIDFGRNLESQLNVYVDCRGALPNLVLINRRLVVAAANLAVKAHKMMRGKCVARRPFSSSPLLICWPRRRSARGACSRSPLPPPLPPRRARRRPRRHSRRTFAFVKACIAFCHISVASLSSPQMRVHLFLLSAQVALLNGCLPQTDTCLGEAIDALVAMPAQLEVEGRRGATVSSEAFVCEAARTILSFLVVVPGHPDASKGPFHMVVKLVEGLKAYAWEESSEARLRLQVRTPPPPPFSACWCAARARCSDATALFSAHACSPPPPSFCLFLRFFLPYLSFSLSYSPLQLDVVAAVAALSQDKLIYTIKHVESNDALFAGRSVVHFFCLISL